MRAPLPADLQPESITAIVDTREQLPLDLSPLRTEAGTLATGDYTVAGLEHVIALERKSLPDLIGCITSGRERFEREVQRLLAYPTRAVIVEADWGELEAGQWRSNLTAASAIGSVLAWTSTGLPFLFVGNREAAGKAVSRMLFIAARRRWREAATLVKGVTQQKTA